MTTTRSAISNAQARKTPSIGQKKIASLCVCACLNLIARARYITCAEPFLVQRHNQILGDSYNAFFNPALRAGDLNCTSRSVLASTAAVLANDADGDRDDAVAFVQTNLDSNVVGVVNTPDVNLTNAWGLAFAPGGAFWVNANHSGTSNLFRGDGSIVPLVVTIPAPKNSPTAPYRRPQASSRIRPLHFCSRDRHLRLHLFSRPKTGRWRRGIPTSMPRTR